MYGENKELDAKVLNMWFDNYDASLLVILPNKKDGISDLESKIANVNFQDLFKTLEEENVNVQFPKFKIESQTVVKEHLQKVSF